MKISSYALLLAASLFLFISSCQKHDTVPTPGPAATDSKPVTRSYSFTNEKVALFPSDKDGNKLSQSRLDSLKKSAALSRTDGLCGGVFIDPSSYQATYLGYIATINGCTSDTNTTVSLNFLYRIDVPANLVTTGSLGTVQLPAGSWPVFAPATAATGVPSFQLDSTYYDGSLGSNVNRYRVAFQVTIRYQYFCSYGTFRTKVTLHTDCAQIDYFSTSYTSFASLTPNSYQTFPYTANGSVSGTDHLIQPIPLISLCGQPCHFPSLGYSNTNYFEYRKAGTTAWNSYTMTGLNNPPPINVNALGGAGTYEYRTRGIVYTSPVLVYSDYSNVNTVVVP
ncbi:hypothetical protein [Chitinophaga vietnamensis]|uniref:hypothetical protein n=1 Tax=Chitinophaga vietnamensis TaxID=2593957 RepID=UPI0011776283|nr:hypothetical protein [Chitinophaga vietnamensis]